ncbi:MAG: hypothetical protein HQK51_11355, partial [Oligoflexia bacterium]|nr:hypothetical protein [Oligoflexia bacterium]
SDVNRNAENSLDKIALFNEVMMILSEQKYCKVSLASPNTPPFKKSANDDPTNIQEGLRVELWLSNQEGTSRTQAKFAKDTKYSGIEIVDMRLYFPNPTTPIIGSDYNESTSHVDIADLKVIYLKLNNRSITFSHTFKIKVFLSTDNDKDTIITSCLLPTVAEDLSAFSFGITVDNNKIGQANWHERPKVCPSGQVVTGFCSSGSNKDCDERVYVYTLKCGTVSGAIVSDKCYENHFPISDRSQGKYISCLPGYVATGFCSSGSNPDCRADTHSNNEYYNILKCCEIIPNETMKSKKLIPKYNLGNNGWFYQESFFNFTDCPANYAVSGACTSGSARDCNGNNHAVQCVTFE